MSLILNKFVSTEAIQFQDNSYFNSLVAIINNYKNKTIDKKEFEKHLTDSIRLRFNIEVELLVSGSIYPNAYIFPVVADPDHMLRMSQYGKDAVEYVRKFGINNVRKLMQQINSGKLSPTGYLDYKHVKAKGLFSKLPTEAVIHQGLIDILTAEEIAAVILHELGHYWTFLEYLGVHTMQNAVINTVANEFLNANTDEEKINIVIEQNNAWGLQVDAAKLAKLTNEEATNVLVGGIAKSLREQKGAVQYNANVSEVLADQFATRMGAGPYIVSGLSKFSSYTKADNVIGSISLIANGLAATLMAVGAAVLTPALIIPTILTSLTLYQNIDMYNHVNGWTYDNLKDRFQRSYNEEVNKLKGKSVAPEAIKLILANLNTMKKIIDTQVQPNPLQVKILRWVSSSFREQESKKLYEQMVEELLANQLYVTGSKFKTLGVQ